MLEGSENYVTVKIVAFCRCLNVTMQHLWSGTFAPNVRSGADIGQPASIDGPRLPQDPPGTIVVSTVTSLVLKMRIDNARPKIPILKIYYR